MQNQPDKLSSLRSDEEIFGLQIVVAINVEERRKATAQGKITPLMRIWQCPRLDQIAGESVQKTNLLFCNSRKIQFTAQRCQPHRMDIPHESGGGFFKPGLRLIDKKIVID